MDIIIFTDLSIEKAVWTPPTKNMLLFAFYYKKMQFRIIYYYMFQEADI